MAGLQPDISADVGQALIRARAHEAKVLVRAKDAIKELSDAPPWVDQLIRITSYNVCYTKLLRAAVAEGLAAAGGKVVVNYVRGPEAAEEVVKGIEERGGEAIAIQADVSKEDQVLRMFQQT